MDAALHDIVGNTVGRLLQVAILFIQSTYRERTQANPKPRLHSHWQCTLCNELYDKQYRSSHGTLQSLEGKWETKQRLFWWYIMQPVISHTTRSLSPSSATALYTMIWMMTSTKPSYHESPSAVICVKDSECHVILELGDYHH